MIQRNQRNDQDEDFLSSYNNNRREREKSWIESNFAYVLLAIIFVLVVASIVATVSQPKTVRSSTLRSEVAKKILIQGKQAQANKMSITPNIANPVKNESQVPKDNYFQTVLFAVKQSKPFIGIKPQSSITPKSQQKPDQLPICIGLLTRQKQAVKSIKQSFTRQQHKLIETFTALRNDTQEKENSNLNLFELNNLIKQSCKQNSIVMLLSGPLPPKFLGNLNKAYQTKNVWITYEVVDGKLFIFSAYQRVFQLLDKNDFLLDNQPYLGKPDYQIITMGLFEISLQHAENIESWKVFKKDSRNCTALQVNAKKHNKYQRTPYTAALSLRHSYSVDREQDALFKSKMLQNKQKNYIAQQASLTQQKLLQSLQYLQLLYLPSQHFLSKREKQYYQKQYELAKITQQLPLCVCIHSYNTIANDKYQRVLLSILQQDYKNYHIVFIDDMSNDGTLSESIRFLKDKKFPDSRATFVQNLERNYWGYNIVNAAINYCKSNEIQVVLNGNDEIVGKMVFKLINYFYQYRQNWVVYTSYFGSQYQYGTSRKFTKTLGQAVKDNGDRNQDCFIGNLRSWYVWILKQIKGKDHKKVNGEWYTNQTVTNFAIQHPLLQLSGPQHIQFIPQLSYLRNNRTQQKQPSFPSPFQSSSAALAPLPSQTPEQEQEYLQLSTRKPYQKLRSFNVRFENGELRREFLGGYGSKFREVDSDEIVSLLARKFMILKQIQIKKEKEWLLGLVEKKKTVEAKVKVQQTDAKTDKKDQNPDKTETTKTTDGKIDTKTPDDKTDTKTDTKTDPKGDANDQQDSEQDNNSPAHNDPHRKDKNLLQPRKVKNFKKMKEVDLDRLQKDVDYRNIFAYNLATNQYNKKFLDAEFSYLDQKYQIGTKVEELPFCVMIAGRNSDKLYNYQYYSVIRQNYSNYNIVYYVDYNENKQNNQALQLFQNYVQFLPQKHKKRTTIIKNSIGRKQSPSTSKSSKSNPNPNIYSYSNSNTKPKPKTNSNSNTNSNTNSNININSYSYSSNRHTTIKNNCKSGDIILDLDSDDWLIGKQVLNTLNHIFQQNKDLWLFIGNSALISESSQISHKPYDFYPEKVLRDNRVRDFGVFETSQFKAFKFQLYDKINQSEELVEFYGWNSDLFMLFPLIQLSCPNHCQKVDDFFYYQSYATRPYPRFTKQYEKMIAVTQTPYQKLQTLYDTSKRKSIPPSQYATSFLQQILSQMQKIESPQSPSPSPSSPDFESPYPEQSRVCTITNFELMEELQKFSKFYENSSYFTKEAYKFINFATLSNTQPQIDFFNQKYYFFKHQQKRKMEDITYQDVVRLVKNQCSGFQIIVFLKSYPKTGSLQKISNILKDDKIWVLYDSSQDGLYANIYAFKSSYLTYLSNEGLGNQNMQILKKYYDFLTIPMLQISNGHALQIYMENFYQSKFTTLIGINNKKSSKNRFKGFVHYEAVGSYK